MNNNCCEMVMVIVGEEFDCGVVGDDCRTVMMTVGLSTRGTGGGGGRLRALNVWWLKYKRGSPITIRHLSSFYLSYIKG